MGTVGQRAAGTAEVEALGAVGPGSHKRMVAEFARAVAAGQSHQLSTP